VAGSSFPPIGFAHGLRVHFPPCLGAPKDELQDYRQYSVVLEHLARWDYVALSELHRRAVRLLHGEAAGSEHPALACGEPTPGFSVRTADREERIVLAGHSTGGSAAFIVATNRSLDVVAIGLLAPGSDSGLAAQIEAPILVIHGTEGGGSRRRSGRTVPRREPAEASGGRSRRQSHRVHRRGLYRGRRPNRDDCSAGAAALRIRISDCVLDNYVRGEKSNQAYVARELPWRGLAR
jgi:hypothetical protein